MRKKIIISLFIFVSCVAFGGIISGVYNWNRYSILCATINSTNAGELQSKLGTVTAELERTKSTLAECQQFVGGLEELDQRRVAGFRRIGAIIDDAGKSVSGIASGEQRARIAFEAISKIVDILETEFSGSANQP